MLNSVNITNRTAKMILALSLCYGMAGCGAGGTVDHLEGGPPSIISGPSSIEEPAGLTAQFSVIANGANLAYVWKENGVAIAGATAATYTTPTLTSANNGETFSVVVSNTLGAVESSPATLTVGARSPSAGDLRFQGVDAAYLLSGYQAILSTNVETGEAASYADYVSPLFIGTGLCAQNGSMLCSWEYQVSEANDGQASPAGGVVSGYLSTLSNQLATIQAPNVVISSLDIEPSGSSFAFVYHESSSSSAVAFDQNVIMTDTQHIATIVANEGINSRVVTALSQGSSGIEILSYGWSQTPTTQYETEISNAQLSSVEMSAQALADSGFIITAVGSLSDGTVDLVGTRVLGDTAPRRIAFVQETSTTTGSSALEELQNQGYAIIGTVFDASVGTTTWMGER